ncbi:glycine zipper 2TM domain-containing protein [Buttiauxella sp. B2]|uniref:glycine zipper 2TM domain-containing protein n=1 Tax=Buttiauxella sp. B2 TaxID=2587812 RepID=UPI00111D6E49|nr:glycine zipper 2TM domain-containing protein [Buttiauxella sp. B2]TNV18849.1 glycine zipper 2TM domain-containing protein [Buttiauxella sp. B2]
MKKIAIIALGLLALASEPGIAGTRTQIEYGTVQDSRITTQGNQHTSRPLRTAGAAAIGAAVGNQFGGGNGKTVATAVGAVAGAEASRNRQGNEAAKQTDEILIKTQDGKLINIVQDHKTNLNFNKGDKVRILTTGSDTVVDKSL